MRWSIVLPGSVAEGMDEVARAAEAADLHRLWTTDQPGRDAILRSSFVLSATTSLRSGTGIAYAFGRGPLAMASVAADAFTLSGGRFALGLGAGTRGQRRWFDQDFDHPAARLADYVGAVRAVLASSGRLAYHGEFYDLEVPRVGLAAPPETFSRLEIFGGGLHPLMLAAIARSCDGVVLHPLAGWDGYLDDVVLPALERGSAARQTPGRLIVWCPVSVAADASAARRRAAEQLAFYFSTPSYHDIAVRAGFGGVAADIVDGFRSSSPGRFTELAALVTDEMLAHFVLYGTPDDVAMRLRDRVVAWEARGVEEIALQITTQSMTPEHLDESLRELLRIIPAISPSVTT